jgi:murein DD-endopeptidase MepM/ murein hydrolase activator NlpD
VNWSATLLVICLPLKHLEITSPFGCRIHPLTGYYSFHNGVDLRAQQDTVYAIMDGTVACSAFDNKLGLFIKLQHPSCWSAYGHLSHAFVKQGDGVLAGQPIGITGATGMVTAEHLHFSIYCAGRYTDPLKFLFQRLILHRYE